MSNGGVFVPDLLSVREVCARLDCHRITVHRLTKSNPAFPAPVRVGRNLRYRSDQIAAWIDSGGGKTQQPKSNGEPVSENASN